MNIIRDNELNGIMMIPLFLQWGIKRCNVKDCKERHTTILTGTEVGAIGLCEKHYADVKKGKVDFIIEN